jgi:hypothetical protein
MTKSFFSIQESSECIGWDHMRSRLLEMEALYSCKIQEEQNSEEWSMGVD